MKNKFITILVVMQLIAIAADAQLYVQNGAILGTTGKAIVTLQNTDLQNNGTISQAATGKFVFTGTSNNNITGSSTTAFDTLEIAKTGSGKLSLSQNATVKTAVQFSVGLIDLNNKQLQLQPNAFLKDESETSRITGTGGGMVIANASAVNAPAAYNLANLGASITSTQNLGTLQISRSHNAVTSPGNASFTGIQRNYIITPENDAGLNATLRFYYFDAELNGKNENTLTLWKSNDGISWSRVGADTRNTTSNYVEKNSIASFSTWALTDALNPLPITLSSYAAACNNNIVNIKWISGVEENGGRFEVEKSIDDGAIFTTIGTVATIGNGSNTYSFIDAAATTGKVFYRIKLITQSGSYNYSPIFSGSCNDITMPFSIYPNPAAANTAIHIGVRQATKAIVMVYNVTGQQLLQWKTELNIGMNVIPVNSNTLPAGNYFIQMLLSDGTILKGNFVKQ
jgi:hypothetical protein